MDNVQGLIGIRGWDCEDSTLALLRHQTMLASTLLGGRGRDYSPPSKRVNTALHSTGVNAVWESSIFKADKKPSLSNSHGIHAYLPNSYKISGDVMGIVELRGKMLLHEEGIIRAEWARILKLFIPKGMADKDAYVLLRAIYGVPMTETDDLKQSIDNWIRHDGAQLIERNKFLLQWQGKTLEEYYGTPNIVKETWIKPEPKPKPKVPAIATVVKEEKPSKPIVIPQSSPPPIQKASFLKRLIKGR